MAWKILSNSFALAWRCLPLQRVHAPAFDYRFPCSSSVSRSSAGLTTFFSPAILLLIWRSRSGRPLHRTVLAAALPLAMIAAYLVYNRISVGVFMPTSGSVKAGLSIVGNLHFFDQVILPKNWFLTRGPTWLFSEVFMRVIR